LLRRNSARYPAACGGELHLAAVVKGKMAILRALLIATVTTLWCFAQFPEILRGTIFPRSVTKYRRILGFL
jgi:hypothetical protein